MPSLRRTTSFLVFLSAAGFAACTSAGFESAEAEHDLAGDSWAERSRREDAVTKFWSENQDDLHWFRDVPLGDAGIPFVVFKLLPAVMPELWGPQSNYLDKIGLFAAPTGSPAKGDLRRTSNAIPRETFGLPYGLGWVDKKMKVGPVEIPTMGLVNITCAACHTGRVKDDSGAIRYSIGAPSQTFDAAAWRHHVTRTAQDPRFTPANFQAALDAQRGEWLYPGNPVKQLADVALFKVRMSAILEEMTTKASAKAKGIHEFVTQRTYNLQWSGASGKDVSALVTGGAPGQVEAFGTLVLGLIPDSVKNMPEGREKESILRSYLPAKPATVDIMSVWLQGQRPAGQWDGSIADPLLRNLGAEIGVIGSAALVDYKNAEATTRFLSHLPSPVYPFAIDGSKLARGKDIYAAACGTCHDSSPNKGYDLGTDPNRAGGLTETSRKALGAAMVSACPPSEREPGRKCSAPSGRAVTIPNTYLALPLDGIWARAPYMHNGSVPTLAQVLEPSKRAATFVRGNLAYDQVEVGFESKKQGPNTTLFDTSKAGFSNAGHTEYVGIDGKAIDFTRDTTSRDALLEYLKTL